KGIAVDRPQLTGYRVRRRHLPRPARLGLQGGKLLGWELGDVTKKEQEGLFRVPCIQEGLQMRVIRRRQVPTAQRERRLGEDEPAEESRQERGVQGTH